MGKSGKNKRQQIFEAMNKSKEARSAQMAAIQSQAIAATPASAPPAAPTPSSRENDFREREAALNGREAALVTREAALAGKEAEALRGFQAKEAEVRRDWVQAKERELAEERERVLAGARDHADERRREAQLAADRIIAEANELAETLRRQVRQQVIQAQQEQQDSLSNLESDLAEQRRGLQLREAGQEELADRLGKEKRRLARLEEELEEESAHLAAERKRIPQLVEERARLASQDHEAKVAVLEAEKAELQARINALDSANEGLIRQRQQVLQALRMMQGSPEGMVKENEWLNERVRQLEADLANTPRADELAVLRQRAESAIQLEADNQDLRARLLDLEGRYRQLQVQRNEAELLRREKESLSTINQYLKAQNEELERLIGEQKEKRTQVFDNFVQLDKEDVETPAAPRSVVAPNLQTLAGATGQWMASLPSRQELEQKGRGGEPFAHYFDQRTIRTLLASMAASRLIVIQGVSGTGKTSLPEYFAMAVGGKSAKIEVQSSWRDKPDLVGFYNSFNRKFNDSPFSRALYEAGLNRFRSRPYFMILDEMNLSRVEYYFADVLSLMEGRRENMLIELLNHDPTGGNPPRGLRQVQGAIKLPIPDNVWFIGTANTDESTYEITRKVYDRAMVLQFDKPFAREPMAQIQQPVLSVQEFEAAKAAALQSYSKDESRRVHDCLTHVGGTLKAQFQVGYGQRMLDQLDCFLPVYRAAGGPLEDGLDHFFSRKVLWQIRHRTDPNVRSGLQQVRDDLEVAFAAVGFSSPAESLELVDEEIRRLRG